jgi:hypothetical protein
LNIMVMKNSNKKSNPSSNAMSIIIFGSILRTFVKFNFISFISIENPTTETALISVEITT